MRPLALGRLKTKLQLSTELLRLCSLSQQVNPYPRIPSDIAALCRKEPYVEVWRLLVSESCFDILLRDYSFFMFKFDVLGPQDQYAISMNYYGCPFDLVSIEDYIVEIYGEEYLVFKDDVQMRNEYEQFLNDSHLVESPVIFRYDYSPQLYTPARHPASHLHIGFRNEIRIGCERVLDPLSFTSFVIRQQYPEIWASNAVIDHQSIFKPSIRRSLPSVPQDYISESDKLEMYLN